MLTSEEKQQVIQDLKKCETAKQVFDYMNAKYKTEECTLSMITKPLMIEGAIKSINLLNPKKR